MVLAAAGGGIHRSVIDRIVQRGPTIALQNRTSFRFFGISQESYHY